MNIKELADKIEKKAGVTVLHLPVGMRFMTRAPNGNMVMIKAGEKWPINDDGSLVMALFQGEDDVRVYTLFAGESIDGAGVLPTRHTISKSQPSIFDEVMTLDTFIDEIANEWVMLDEGVSTAERERAAVVEFLRTKAAVTFPAQSLSLADRIEAEEHLENDEEDDEDKTVVPSGAPIAAS